MKVHTESLFRGNQKNNGKFLKFQPFGLKFTVPLLLPCVAYKLVDV